MSDTAITIWVVAARVLHYGSALVLFGYAVFQGLLMPRPAAANRLVIRLCVALFVLSALLWLAGEAATVGDGWPDALKPGVLWNVLTETSFGHVFSLQLAAGVMLVLLLPAAEPRALAAVSGVSLIALGVLGHAVMFAGWWNLLLPVAQALHLLAAGFWVGGLLAIVHKPAHADPAWGAALMRFSWVGQGAVALVILTGVGIGFTLLAFQPAPWNRLYVTLLLVKATTVAVMTGLALFNRYVLVPRLARSPDAQTTLMQVTRVNLGLAAAVILLVSLLGQLSPSIDP